MDIQFAKIKKLLGEIEKNKYRDMKVELLNELIDSAKDYRNKLTSPSNKTKFENKRGNTKPLNIHIEKISQETFLYKAVTVKNYYEGNYLEKFSEMRTSDLKISNAFDIHNQFWQAHEVTGGNIFASIPIALIDNGQVARLRDLNWNPVEVEVFEITNNFPPKTTRGQIINAAAGIFDHHLLVREVYGNILMLLHYQI